MCCTFCKVFWAFFAPPLVVLCHSGCTSSFFINVILTLLGFVPGIVHAIFVIFTEKKQGQQGVQLTNNVNVVAPQMMPMYQPVQPPPAPYYPEPAAPPVYYPEPPAPPVYYPGPCQKF